jgi:hypothetical protein
VLAVLVPIWAKPNLTHNRVYDDTVVFQIGVAYNQIVGTKIRNVHKGIGIDVIADFQSEMNEFGDSLLAVSIIPINDLRVYEIDRENFKLFT